MTTDPSSSKALSSRTRITICLIIFLVALGVRVLSWHDTRLEVGKVQTVVVGDYQRVAGIVRQGGVAGFLSSSSPLSDLNTLGHPPGYSILMAFVFSLFGQSNASIQFFQIIADAFAAIVIFLIVAELLSGSAGLIAGLLAAFSPQFAWNSVLLLPDSLSVLPILLAVYCVARAYRNPRLITFVAAGALVGLSCWLRANAMLLTIFLAFAVLLLFRTSMKFRSGLTPARSGSSATLNNADVGNDNQKSIGPRWRYAAAIIFGTFLIVAPLTIRNAIAFHRFIPVSLGAGQTLLEGIGDYDTAGRFKIPSTDIGVMKMEAEERGRPDYYGTFFNPDGVERERWRLARGFGVIRAHPFWFSGVMVRRAGSMLKLERSRLISTEPPVSHSLDAMKNLQPEWTRSTVELLASSLTAKEAIAENTLKYEAVYLTCNDEKYGEQFQLPPIPVKRNTDYVFQIPISIERGRMRVSVKSLTGKIYSSAILEPPDPGSSEQQPVNQILAFVAPKDELVRISFSNEASNPPRPVVEIYPVKLFNLGPSGFLWTRYPRLLVNLIQKLFVTAVMLPLAIIGLVLLIVKRRWPALIILLTVPVYFFCVQSIVHTEYRYVLAVDYFLFALAALSISWVINLMATGYSLLGARTSRPQLSAKRE